MSLFAGSIASRMFEPARWVAGEVRRLPVQPRSHTGIRGLGGGGELAGVGGVHRSPDILVEDLVTVKIDAEAHRQLAERYGVSGFPAQLLIAPDGSVISRESGYQTGRQLLGWLDRSLGRAGVSSASF